MVRSLWRIVRALVLALWGHRGQKDKAGKAYWRHLVTVAWIAYGLTHDPEAVVVGLLHDYIEDVKTPGGEGRIYRIFGAETCRRVMWLTRNEDEDRRHHLGAMAINADYIVIAVKIGDLLHNTKPGRLPQCKDDAEVSCTTNRLIEYQWGIERLTGRRTWSEPHSWRGR